MINALLTSKPENSFSELDGMIDRIDQEHQRCIHSPQTALIHACNAGLGLIKLRSKLSPQQWQNWLMNDCPLRPETAQTYMQMATKCAAFPQTLSLSSSATSQPNLITGSHHIPLKNPSENDVDESHKTSPQTAGFSTVNQPRDNSARNTIPQSETISTKPQEKVSYSTPFSQTQSGVTSQPIKPPSNTALEPFPEAVIDVDFVSTTPPQSQPDKAGIIRFCLAGGVVPKARPRVTSHGTHLPQRYRAWRNQAEVELYRQMCEMHPAPQFPLEKAAISLRFFGNHRTNSDIDNLAGACLDALTLNGAGILKDDRLSCLPQLSVEFVPGTPETGVWIEIEPLI